jgi:hypothetical protein
MCSPQLVIILELYINQLKVNQDRNINLEENTTKKMT